MSTIPACARCGRDKKQPGRYADWVCECCDESARCPHVSFVTRLKRRFLGRQV